MREPENVSLTWPDFIETMRDVRKNLYTSGPQHDVTISTGQSRYKAHQIVLASCSEFFRQIFLNYPENLTPTVCIPDMEEHLLEPLMAFLYTGEAFINTNLINEFLEICNFLKIKGLINCQVVEGNKDDGEKLSISHETDDERYHEVDYVDTSDPGEEAKNQSLESAADLLNKETFVNVYTNFANEIKEANEGELIEVCGFESDNSDHDHERSQDEAEEEIEKSKSVIEVEAVEFIMGEEEIELLDDTSVSDYIIKTDKTQEINKTKEPIAPKASKNKSTFSAHTSVYRETRNAIISKAVKDIGENGISLQQASNKYGISKTVLWRNLRQTYNAEKKVSPSRHAAIIAIGKGESLLSVSKKYKIPLSTLHRDKVKLFAEGKLPKHCVLKKREGGHDFQDRLKTAIMRCKNGMSQKEASELYRIPKTTIWRNLQEKPVKNQDSMDTTDESTDQPPQKFNLRQEDCQIRLKEAVESCLMGMSQIDAAESFRIPKATLRRYFNKKKILSLVDSKRTDNDQLETESHHHDDEESA